jgi:ribonuclease HII
MRRASVLLDLLKFDEDLRQLLKTGRPVKNCPPTQGLQLTLFPCQVEHLIGVDEVGRGCLAGPVVAGAVSLRQINWNESLKTELDRLNDSKLIVTNTRNKLAEILIQHTTWGIGQAAVDEINRLGITAAAELAMKRAVDALLAKLQVADSNSIVVLVDGRKPIEQLSLQQVPIPAADAKSACVAAASVIAKVHRDNIMKKLSAHHPEYKWALNKGYPSPSHLDALSSHGRTSEHRQSFAQAAVANLAAQAAPSLLSL